MPREPGKSWPWSCSVWPVGALRDRRCLLRRAAVGAAAGAKYLMLVPLAWSLGAAPPELARGVAGDYGMLVAALITVGLIIWRDHASSAAWQSVTAWPLFALMIAWSGHEDVLMGLAVVLVAVTLAQAIGHRRPSHGWPIGSARTAKLKVS